MGTIDTSSTKAPAVPSGLRVYAVGDVHGRADLLDALHARIVEEAAAERPEEVRLVYLGDYIDRGPDSYGVVERLLAPLPRGWRRIALRGNHEDMMLRALADEDRGDLWVLNGGLATMESYFRAAGTAMPPAPDKALAALHGVLPDRHLAFYAGLASYHVCGGYVFVHAGLRPGVALAEQNPDDLRWIRRPFLDSEADFGAMVVHGHSIVAKPEQRPNRIGIDTGAYASGVLTALVLEGATRRFLQVAS